MRFFYQKLDRFVSFTLVVFVSLMVLSITTEIVLNAVVQPAANHLMRLFPSWNYSIEPVMKSVAVMSSPVNTLSQTLLVWVGILGSAYAWKQRAHLGVDVLVRVYPAPVRFWLDRIATLMVAIFSTVVLVIGGYLVVAGAFSRGFKMPGIEWLNQGWFYLVLLITGVLNLFYCFYHWFDPQPAEAWQDVEGESVS